MTTTIEMSEALQPRREWEATDCPMASALDVIHTRSAFLVLREAYYGATRYEEFTRRTGLSDPVTAARLRELTEAGILDREPYQEPGQRTRQRYLLTDKGSELLPVLVALMQWGDRWEQDGQAPVEIRHRGCGAAVTAQLRCASDHAVAGDELELAGRRPRRARPPAG
ncbi:MAG: helix-turn-helix domain-containing protein [Solirubrobacteraceae bacterium]